MSRFPYPLSLARSLRCGALAFPVLTLSTLLTPSALAAESHRDIDEAPISVFFSPIAPQNAVTRLAARIKSGELTLDGTDRVILRTLLRELQIPYQSQIVVFSRTSLQSDIIRPSNPRALYFSDSAYVGWVPGGLIEITVMDPVLGPTFYALDPQDLRDAKRSFVRDVSCIGCHSGSANDGTPGRLFAHSLFTSGTGEPIRRSETSITLTEQTPFEQRWGGWYVTGYTGTTPHRGNAFSREVAGQVAFTPSDLRPADLSRYLEIARYPAATSDVVALLIFEHQLAVHDAFTHAQHQLRQLDAKSPAASADTRDRLLSDLADDILDHLLFRNAAPLPDGIEGSASYQRAFASTAKRDAAGQSLKDLSLKDRLFANRCSFLIYSEAFTALPAELKNIILGRLADTLHDTEPGGRYGYLEPEEKKRILAILTETHPEARAHLAGP